MLGVGFINISFAQANKVPLYEIIISNDGFSMFDGKSYTYLTIFLNNNSDETFYYQGTDCYNLLFSLKRNSYFHLADDLCNNTVYSKMAVPPHRSQKMQIFLTMDKQPDRDVLLDLSMKLYKWEDQKTQQSRNLLPGKLSDSTVLHYNSGHQYYWPILEDESLDKKAKRILPNKDIYLLSDSDRKLYTLVVDKKQISKPRDTVVKTFRNKNPNHLKVVDVPVFIQNNSNDTLKFYSMSCSWFEFWDTDRNDVKIADWPCEKNVPEIITIPPHHKVKNALNIMYGETIDIGSQYQISMSLLKVSDNLKRGLFFSPDEYLHFNKIWSNKITIR